MNFLFFFFGGAMISNGNTFHKSHKGKILGTPEPSLSVSKYENIKKILFSAN